MPLSFVLRLTSWQSLGWEEEGFYFSCLLQIGNLPQVLLFINSVADSGTAHSTEHILAERLQSIPYWPFAATEGTWGKGAGMEVLCAGALSAKAKPPVENELNAKRQWASEI